MKVSLHAACQKVETCHEDVCGSTLDIAKGERPSDSLFIQDHDTRSDCCCCPMLGRFVAVDDEGASTPTETAETTGVRRTNNVFLKDITTGVTECCAAKLAIETVQTKA